MMMKFYADDLVIKIREKRKLGASLRNLEREFHIPNTTISKWVRDIYSNDPNFKRARKEEEESKLKYKYLVNRLRITKTQARILAALLYWCEGSKYPASDTLAFSNSDTSMVRTFLALLRKGFNITEEKLRVHLQLHTTHNLKESFNFWSGLLNVGADKFIKPTITSPTNSMKRRNYQGTCTIRYYDVKLMLQITGIFEAFANKFGEVPEWTNGTRC